MALDLAERRRCFAEEIQIVANIQTPELIEAFARVPRERFHGIGPWTIRSESDFQKPPRQTPGAGPGLLCHNVAVAIDESRTLFSGVPGLLATFIDALGVRTGSRVAHVGTGNGYYTAVIAETVGPSGRVVGIEVDAELAVRATAGLAPWPQAQIVHGDATAIPGGPFDAILVNAGVTHVLPHWLENLAPGGRMLIPLTATMAGPFGPAMANIGKGIMVMITKAEQLDARLVTFVAIYSAIGLRDDGVNAKIGAALARNPYPQLKRLRFDPHDAVDSCWIHDDRGCWSLS